MTIFDAVLTEIRGHRAVELKFRVNEKDHCPRRVLLIEEARQTRAWRLPFVWRFAHESTEPQGPAEYLAGEGAPVLTVIAAPGVSVQLDGFPFPRETPLPERYRGPMYERYMARPGWPSLNIYRIQDPAALPLLASDTPSVHLVGTYEVADHAFDVQVPGARPGDPPTTARMSLFPNRYFSVEQLPNSVVINHLGSGDQWTITVPRFADDPRTSEDALARFAFEIDLDAGLDERSMLKIVSTPAVQVTVMERHVFSRLFGEDLEPEPQPLRGPYWARWEVDYIHEVPLQGTPIEPTAGWRQLYRVRRIPNLEEQALARKQTLIDVGVGFIPIVGDAVDIAELLYGVVTGEDKWGNSLSTGDLALLGLGAVLPFVSGPALRGTRRLVQRFAEHADEAAELARRIKQAGLTAEDVAVIRRFEALIKAGRRAPPELWNQALAILHRVPAPQPTIDVLLNAERTGFAHIELQAAYRRYSANQIRDKLPVKDPVDWARATRGRPRDLLVTLLGPEFAKRPVRVDAPLRNLLDVPRPVGLTDELLAAHLDTAFKSEGRVWERLGKLLAEPQDAGAASLGLLHRQVSTGRFGILKGNLAEIFSIDIQRAELARIAKKYPTALLVSGVRVRLMRDGKRSASKLFSDNIIIVKKGNRVQVLAVFEVKAGFKGGPAAAEQIFDWIEDRFTDGSQLVLPKGSTLTSAGRRPWTIKRELTFTWKPSNKNVPMVTGLASAGERHLITARGSSALGIDSGLGVGAKVISHALLQTSAELDYLCAHILLGRTTRVKNALLPVVQ